MNQVLADSDVNRKGLHGPVVAQAPMPSRDHQIDVQAFAGWLAVGGAEIGVPTNPYELLRYRAYPTGATKMMTSIIYRKETGQITWTGASFRHYRQFLDGVPMICAPAEKPRSAPKAKPAKGASKSEVTREKLIERDGDQCWFCGLALGDDKTIEHLVPKSAGGRNTLANYALAHRACNNHAADMPLIEKIELRQRLRAPALTTA